jgi:hypothetical protein
MPTKELEDALKASKLGNAERDLIDVIARVLEMPENLVERVLYAAETGRGCETARACEEAVLTNCFEGESLDPDLKRGIQEAVRAGVARTVARWHIANEQAAHCPVDKLISDPAKVCDGCPISLACVAHSLSTPQRCVELGPPTGWGRVGRSAHGLERHNGSCARIVVLKIVGDTVTVTCEHPKGTYQVQAKDLLL